MKWVSKCGSWSCRVKPSWSSEKNQQKLQLEVGGSHTTSTLNNLKRVWNVKVEVAKWNPVEVSKISTKNFKLKLRPAYYGCVKWHWSGFENADIEVGKWNPVEVQKNNYKKLQVEVEGIPTMGCVCGKMVRKYSYKYNILLVVNCCAGEMLYHKKISKELKFLRGA